jgi:hypothetical protein
MVAINMSTMQLKVIRKEVCLKVRDLSRLSKDRGPKKHPNTWRRKKKKKVKDFMKVEEEGVNHKNYDGCCTKQ